VYVGAVSILIVFAILLTRGDASAAPAPIATATPWAVAIAVAAFATMTGAVLRSPEMMRRFFLSTAPAGGPGALAPLSPGAPSLPVKSLGERLMGDYILPLEILGLLLTAALIGAVIIAMQEKRT
jgi:NADH-quinone oxidoreductase subunit J